jgi:anaerobic ribonucleoside-triphosphate reductase activating protein
MKFRCAGTSIGTINGIGISYEIFFSGCRHNCPDCQNLDLQDFSYGTEIDTDDILYHLEKYRDFYSSVVFTGGDPVYQPIPLYTLASKCNLPTILYTGFLYEDLPECIRNVMDFIVDGPYIQELKTDGFPASSNQRIWQSGKLINQDFRKNYYANTNNI